MDITSKPFLFDPAKTPAEGDVVLVRVGDLFQFETYHGQQALGVCEDVILFMGVAGVRAPRPSTPHDQKGTNE